MAEHRTHDMAWDTWHTTRTLGTGHRAQHGTRVMAWDTRQGTHGMAWDTWHGTAHRAQHGTHGTSWHTWHGMGHVAWATHPQHWAATSLEKVGGIWGRSQPNKPKALGITLRLLFSPSRFFQLFHPLNCFSPSEMCPEILLDLHGRAGGSALLWLSQNAARCHNGKLSCRSLFHSHLSLGVVVVFLATFPRGDSRFRLIFRSFRFKGSALPGLEQVPARSWRCQRCPGGQSSCQQPAWIQGEGWLHPKAPQAPFQDRGAVRVPAPGCPHGTGSLPAVPTARTWLAAAGQGSPWKGLINNQLQPPLGLLGMLNPTLWCSRN